MSNDMVVVVVLEMMMLTVEPVMRPGVAPVQPGAAPAEHEAAFVGPSLAPSGNCTLYNSLH